MRTAILLNRNNYTVKQRILRIGYISLLPYNCSTSMPAFINYIPAFLIQRTMYSRTGRKMEAQRLIRQFLRDESGATAIEYGLIAALIAVVIIGAVTAVGSNLNGTFNNIANNVSH